MPSPLIPRYCKCLLIRVEEANQANVEQASSQIKEAIESLTDEALESRDDHPASDDSDFDVTTFAGDELG